MAEMIIQLVTDSETGKRDIIVKLNSDADSLPFEHDHLHRELVEKLIEGGTLKASEVGQLIIEREENLVIDTPLSEGTQQDQRESEEESS